MPDMSCIYALSEHEQLIEITVVNDRIPEIGTTAAVDGEKEICATEVFTLKWISPARYAGYAFTKNALGMRLQKDQGLFGDGYTGCF